jgi:hypothetical protein
LVVLFYFLANEARAKKSEFRAQVARGKHIVPGIGLGRCPRRRSLYFADTRSRCPVRCPLHRSLCVAQCSGRCVVVHCGYLPPGRCLPGCTRARFNDK